jgi:hypothetical protein
MKYIISVLMFAALACPAWAEPNVKINVKWLYKDFSSPVNIYEAKGRPILWQTGSVASLAKAPVGEQIAASSFEMLPGQKKRFVLIAQNSTDKPQYFFAAPHTVHPEEESLGFKFKCLCINHAYTINPKETWYRVVEFRLSPQFVGKELTITHTIIGIDAKRAASFSQEHDMSAMPDM